MQGLNPLLQGAPRMQGCVECGVCRFVFQEKAGRTGFFPQGIGRRRVFADAEGKGRCGQAKTEGVNDTGKTLWIVMNLARLENNGVCTKICGAFSSFKDVFFRKVIAA